MVLKKYQIVKSVYDLERVLHLVKMYIKYKKSMEIPHSAICLFKFCSLPLMTVLQMFFCIVLHE